MSNINFDPEKSANYDDLARKAVFGYDQLFKMALSYLSRQPDENKNILVVGSGTGMELLTFGKQMPACRIMGVDPSEEMINISRARLEENELTPRVTLLKGHVNDLPEIEKYDAATLIFVMRFIPDEKGKLSLLKNISKRLKPGAQLIIVDQFGIPGSDDFQSVFTAWLKFMRLNGATLDLSLKIADQALEKSFLTGSGLENMLSQSGFGSSTVFYRSFFHCGWIVNKL